MAKENKLVAETRALSGSASARRMRHEGWLPGIINTDKGEARMIRLNRHDFEMMLHRHASENLILDMQVDAGEPRKVLLKEVQHHNVSGEAIHADFLEISMTKKMRIHIAIHLVGEPVGVSLEGGVLEHPVRQVEVECLPTDLVEQIDVDVTAMKIGDSLLVRDMKVDPKLTILTPGDVAVALVSEPHVEEVAAPVEGAAVEGEAAAAEPAVIEKGKEKAEGEEAAPAAPEKPEPKKEKKEKR